jgi:hypothetical protein
MVIPFTSSDVWLLVSIALAESEPAVGLAEILFAGDAINKAVFTPQELRRGLSKLTKAHYVNDASGIYSLTDTGHSLIADARKNNRDWLSIWQHIEKRLGATHGQEDAPQYEDLRFPYPSVTDDGVAEADQLYRAKFAKLLAELEALDP